jgi:outer membrane protein TolC
MGIDPRTPIDVTQNDEPTVADNDMNALVDRALKQRPDVKMAEDNLLSAEHGVKAARTTNAPVLSGNLALGTSGPTIPTTNDAFSFGFSINWNPFDGGFTAGKVKEARADQAIAASQALGVKLSVISDVSQAYTLLRHDELRVLSAKNSVANATEGLRIAVGRFSSGLGIFLDIITAESALESAESDLTLATMSVDDDRSALAHAIGAPVPTTP